MLELMSELKSAPKQLSDEDLLFFEENGYIVFKDVLSKDELSDIRDAMTRLCLKACNGYKEGSFTGRKGKPETPFAGWNLRDKNSNFSVGFEADVDINNATNEELSQSYRKLNAYHDQDPVFENFKTHEICSNYRNQLLGENSILSQDMALSKPAEFGREKPWHQDNAYFTITPLQQVIGIWVAIDDATIENGCMHVLPTKRYNAKAYKHVYVTDCEIDKNDLPLDQTVPVEVPAGGAIFFLGMVPHQTPPNHSQFSRRALQWHYRGADTVFENDQDYREIFKTVDGRPAACSAASE
jgi:phytanoyl-CoA hydroxylase